MSNNRRRVRTIDYVALQGLQLSTIAMATATATSPPAQSEDSPTAPIRTSQETATTPPPVPPIRLRRELNVDEDARWEEKRKCKRLIMIYQTLLRKTHKANNNNNKS